MKILFFFILIINSIKIQFDRNKKEPIVVESKNIVDKVKTDKDIKLGKVVLKDNV